MKRICFRVALVMASGICYAADITKTIVNNSDGDIGCVVSFSQTTTYNWTDKGKKKTKTQCSPTSTANFIAKGGTVTIKVNPCNMATDPIIQLYTGAKNTWATDYATQMKSNTAKNVGSISVADFKTYSTFTVTGTQSALTVAKK